MKQTANYAKEVPVFGGKRQLQQLVLSKDQIFPKDTASAKDPRDFQTKARTAPHETAFTQLVIPRRIATGGGTHASPQDTASRRIHPIGHSAFGAQAPPI